MGSGTPAGSCSQLGRARRGRVSLQPITIGHAVAAEGLPVHHSDPFDRMLIAQARAEHLVLVSVDARFSRYDVELLPLP